MLLRFAAAFAILLPAAPGCSRETPTGAATAPSASIETKSAEPPKGPTGPAVVLSLERASATRGEHGVHFECETSLLNRTGATLHVVTNFSSPFDGLEIVVAAEDGKELARQAYIYHQSPYAENQRVPLPPGVTTKTLSFPIADLTGITGTVYVKLAGGLPGTALRSGLHSNQVEAVIEDETKKTTP